MAFLLPVVLLLASSTAATTTTMGGSLSVMPGCKGSCGGVDIPYPFGIGNGCFRQGFEIVCSSIVPGVEVPVLAAAAASSSAIRVANLSVAPWPEARVLVPVAWQCFNATGDITGSSTGDVNFNPQGVYRVSNNSNELYVLGCNTFVYAEGGQGGRFSYGYYAGCVAATNDSRDAQDGSCDGLGCCHVDIPPGITDFTMHLSGTWSHANQSFCPCDYAFIVEKGAYTFMASDLASSSELKNQSMQMVLDWAIRDNGSASVSCAQATDRAGYACLSTRSECINSTNGPGYFCKCTQGSEGNPYILDGCTTNPSNSRTTHLWVTIILVVAAVMLVGLMAALLCIILRRRRRRQGPIPQIDLPVARKFSYPKLAAATNNFSEDRKLGAGSFGEVYRGDLQDPSMPQPVAVKRLTRMMERTMTDYVTEVTTLGKISHRNLVRLVGWCDVGGDGDNAKLLLVYELVARGSLDRHLHASDQRLLTWAERYKIVLDIGNAIEYLHTGCLNPILHRDIKPSNVMLDEDFVAKLGDFGLVRQAPGRGQGTLAGTAMIGSSDYIDPVCISNGTVSTASDMYSFGVLLLEMATGEDPAAMREKLSRQYALVEAVQESYSRGRVLEMADERLNGDYDEWQMERVLVVGLLCVQAHRQDRPTIKRSIAWLSYRAHEVPAVRLPMHSPVTKTTE